MMARKKLLSNISGFTMIGMLITTGLMGGLTLILNQIALRQIIVQRTAETGMEISEMVQQVVYALRDEKACLNTIAQVTGPIVTGSTYSLTSIMRKNNPAKTLLTSGNTYRNDLIRIESIVLTDVETSTGSSSIGEMNLKIVFIKNSRMIEGNKRVVKKFPVTVEMAPNGQALYCTSHIDASLASAKKKLCMEIGGIFDDNTLTCSSPLAGKQCPSGEYMVGFDNGMNPVCTAPTRAGSFDEEKNCYLLTTYNNGNYLSGISGNPWRIVSSDPIENNQIWQLELQDTGGHSRDFIDNQKADCKGDGYTDQFRTISQTPNVYRHNLVFHYCCR